MAKRLLVLLLALLCLSSCGSDEQTAGETENDSVNVVVETEPETEEAAPAQLTGQWTEKEYDPAGTWMTASIDGDVIEIYWNMDGGETKALYWAGTYTAPTEPGDFSWISANDKEKTDTALLASGADTKEFRYESGEILFEASAMGVTSTVHLIPAEG